MDSKNRQSRRRQWKRKKERKLIAILAGLCLAAVIILAMAWQRLHRGPEQGAREGESQAETFLVELPDGMEYNTIETSGEGPLFPGTGGESPQGEAPQPGQAQDGGAGESQTGETKGAESPYLKNLSGLEPGTILEESQIDFQNLDKYFMSWRIEEGDNLYERINGKSYRKNDYVPLDSLRYLKMPHYNFQGKIQVGEMVVSTDVMEDVKNIFRELFEAKYQIQSMYLVDNYWTGDPDTTDSASIEENNTSAFCYRQITGGGKLSNHAYGKAIDINPQQNPYVSYSSGSPKWSHANADDYIDRSTGLPHVITHEDLAYRVFSKYGFQWGGDWTNPKDYQHFDKNKK